MSATILRNRLDSILEYMSPYWSWVNCHMVNYLTDNHWNRYVPPKLLDELHLPSNVKECIEEVFWKSEGILEKTKYPECRKFRHLAEQHSLHAFENVIITPEEFKAKILKLNSDGKQIKIKEFLTEKKRHEVEVTASLVNDLITCSVFTKVNIIVDAGDGKGYLSSRLCLEYGHKVLGIDSNPANTENALERNKKLKKAWNGLKERAELESAGLTPARRGNKKQKLQQQLNLQSEHLATTQENDNYKTIDQFITSNMDLTFILQQQFPEILKPNICLTGLHTCGNLAATCLKLFHTQPNCKILCNIGCCYHLLKEQYSETEFFGNKQILDLNQEIGFPLSKYLQEKEVKLGRNARMLAAQSIDRTLDAKELPNISLFYRAVLELLICEEHPELKDQVQVGKIRKFTNFKEYVELCCKKYPNLKFSKDRIEAIAEMEESSHKMFLNLFYLLRMTFAPILESLILLDRLLYLKEMGYEQSFLIPLFDAVVSPRHFAIVAMKD